jgi:hypothetical protein
MTSRMKCFNTYFLAAALALIAGCTSPPAEPGTDARKKEDGKSARSRNPDKKEFTLLRLHMQVNPDGTQFTVPATVYRANPVTVTVMATPVVMEANIVRAALIEDTGGYSIGVQFDQQGALLLENATTAYRGSRLVVFGRWGTDKAAEDRWLGAVFIANRITDGTFTFTPDASREEAERIVTGLNNVAERLRTGK